MPQLGELEAFVAVIEAGGFSAAAPRLGLTPSAVSKLIGRLEERLGLRLLQRTTRQLRPTAEGEAYFARARGLLDELRDMDAEIAGERGAARGLLRVNCSVGLGLSQLTRLVPDFLQRHKQVRLELALEDRFVDLVGEGFDIGIRLGRRPESALRSRQLGTIARRIFASPAYLERMGTPRTPEDLAQHNCLNFSTMAWLNAWPLKTGRERQPTRGVDVSGNFLGNNGELLYQMALEGVGIMRLADFMVADDIRAGRLVPLLEEFDPRESVPLYLVWPAQRFEPPRLRAFIDYMVECFTPAPPWRR